MAIYQTLTDSFKQQCLQAVQNFGPTSPDTFKIALYTAAASLGADTTAYSTTGEVVGTGYAAGGIALTISQSPTVASNTAYVNFANAQWLNASFTARGALIYNYTKGNKSVGVINFGLDQTTLNQDFLIQFPYNNPETAVIRVL